jgi:hypothetical protein
MVGNCDTSGPTGSRLVSDDIYPERLCAFIDKLGFRGLVARLGWDAGAVESLRKVLREVHKPIIPGLVDPASVDYRTQSISDAVAISTVPTPDGLMMLFGSLNQLTFNLLAEGYFVRGAIVRGCLYHDDEMIFGEALVRAYDLETAVVKYPRIMIHSQVISKLPAGVPSESCKSNVLVSDDGPMHLNVLSRMNHDLSVMAGRRKLEGIIPLATLPGLHHQYARICFAIGTALESSIHRFGFNNVERRRLCCFRFSHVVGRILQHLAIEMDIVARHPR